MKKILTGLVCLFGISVATAQMVTYLDAQGRPFMYSSKVGNQTTYMDKNGKPVAYMNSPSSGPRIDPINAPSLVFPMISPSLPGSQTIKPLPSTPTLPSLPELPTLKGF
jgi:hypothetical protein